MLNMIKKLAIVCVGIAALAGAAWGLNQIDNLPLRLDEMQTDHAIVYLYPNYTVNRTLDRRTARALTREIDALGLRDRTDGMTRPATADAVYGFWLGMSRDLPVLIYADGAGISVDGTAYRADCTELIDILERALEQ